ncbi:hypothetical protein ABFX02_02G157300 [Erythranthe guttata]
MDGHKRFYTGFDYTGFDFLQLIDEELSIYIMSFLDDQADLVRAGAVSRYWRQFVTANRLAKRLRLKKMLQYSKVAAISDASGRKNKLVEPKEREIIERNQKVYSSLMEAVTKSKVTPRDCIDLAISASSTNDYSNRSRENTLYPTDRYNRENCYWASKGQRSRDGHETLIYKLKPGILVITEIDIQPFQDFSKRGSPIFSAKSVRFRIGHTKNGVEVDEYISRLTGNYPIDHWFAWTYTSPEFPMIQENSLQPFKLPEPVLCSRAYLQIELMGRVQQNPNGLYHICVCYVRVMGRTLSPAFEIEMVEPNGNTVLKYYPDKLNSVMKNDGPVVKGIHPFWLSASVLSPPSRELGPTESFIKGFSKYLPGNFYLSS